MNVITPTKGRRNTPMGGSSQKPNNLNQCLCNNQEPILKTFSLKDVNGKGYLLGICCDRCSTVIDWTHQQNEKVEAELKYNYYPVVAVNPVLNKPDYMIFMCHLNGCNFPVTVPSKVEKVNNAIKTPTLIVGKYAQLEYSNVNERGIPVNPIVKTVISKERLPQTLN
jgi:hypothetical protein